MTHIRDVGACWQHLACSVSSAFSCIVPRQMLILSNRRLYLTCLCQEFGVKDSGARSLTGVVSADAHERGELSDNRAARTTVSVE